MQMEALWVFHLRRSKYDSRAMLCIRRFLSKPVLYALLCLPGIAVPAFGQQQSAASPTSSPAAVFQRYCVTCHNSRLKTAGFILDPSGLADVAANSEIWQKVDRKLRSYAMPPAGVPRPDEATYNLVASQLEAELDRAATKQPNVGELPLLHRLTRTEYQNAIRDLVALDALPQEMDYSMLLPEDSASSGFDNIAELLFVSPSDMERYLGAAQPARGW
jgi:mono/diheme cytochrome c family protein